jgi:hypothetical protein
MTEVAKNEEITRGDIIQLNPGPWFGGCLAMVTEVKPWGVQCFVAIPQDREVGPSCAFYRATTGSYVKVGRARWDVSDFDEPGVLVDPPDTEKSHEDREAT